MAPDTSNRIRRVQAVNGKLKLAALLGGILVLGGCSSDMFSKDSSERWFSKPLNSLATPEWAVFSSPKDTSRLRPVTADDYVDANGGCAAPAAPAEGAAAPTPAPGANVGLTMTECEVVARAGRPERIEIGTNAAGDRSVAMTYNRGTAPGIYRFTAGRLSEVEATATAASPSPQKPASRRQARKPKTAAAQ